MHHRLAFAIALAAALVASSSWLAGSARAQQRMPDMATLDRGDGITRLGLDFGAAFIDDDIVGIDAALRFDLFGQFVSYSGLGVYGSMPFSVLVAEGDNETAIGNLELGGLYVIDSPTVSFVFRAGVALPTAADEEADEVLANVLATWARLTDAAQALPDATFVRLAFSPLYHDGGVFLRADLGVDLEVTENEDSIGVGLGGDPENLFRLNVGGGVDLGTVAVMAELVNLASSSSFDDGDEEDFVHTFAVSARFMGESLQPYFTVGLPVDEFSRDLVDFFLGAGLQIAP